MNETKLIILRGPSGSGKSSVAKEIQARRRNEGKLTAYVEQDHFRRIVLKEKDVAGGFNAELIKETVLFLLQNQYDVILEGIFDAGRYEKMLGEIILAHPSDNYFFYFDISFEETLRRHETKPCKNDFGEKEMRSWYKDKDFLKNIEEIVILEDSSLKDTIEQICRAAQL